MMRPFNILCTALVIMGAMVATASAENPKMATVDMQKLFKEYHRTIAAQKRFNLEYARIQKGINERGEAMVRMRSVLKTLNGELKGGGLSDGQKTKKENEGRLLSQELKMMTSEVKRYSEMEKGKVTRLKAASMQGIMKEIRQKVIDHSKAQGYDYVFDKSGKNTNQVSFFLYLKDAKDITANMLKELNKFAPGADGN